MPCGAPWLLFCSSRGLGSFSGRLGALSQASRFLPEGGAKGGSRRLRAEGHAVGLCQPALAALARTQACCKAWQTPAPRRPRLSSSTDREAPQ
eukprot:949273-Pyramimonas_sp.AAC.1